MTAVTAVLWGDKTRTMSWVRIHPSGERESIASADKRGFYVRNTEDVDLAMDVLEVWRRILNGIDLEHLATHELERPQMRNIVAKTKDNEKELSGE